ncbi:LysM peptidoglycan-binding domain-containing protein [Nocardioides endophyticus]|uniref:LysM peptidoglycan-binding domain-containing protein n=1 Tax=Nocardioides endophyticus TaxID=1353775 RepID=A0ABP8YQM9_9ACTN
MISSPQVPLARCLAVLVVATAGCALLVAWLLPATREPGAATFDAALVRLCAGLALLATGWLWLSTVVTVLCALRGRGRYAAGVPASLRRAVLAACGVALASGLGMAGPAHATPGRLHEDRVADPVVLVGLPLPDRATALPADLSTVVVAPGDTLWAIAARSLGPDASTSEIDVRWRRLYDLNRAVIGPDPDLIRPAQRLEVLP